MNATGASIRSVRGSGRRASSGRLARRARFDLPFACYLFVGIYWVSFCLSADFSRGGPLPEPGLDSTATVVLAIGCAACLAFVSGWSRIVAYRKAIVAVAIVAVACHLLARSLGEEQPILRGAYPTWGVVVFWVASLLFIASLVTAWGASVVRPRSPTLVSLGVWSAGAALALGVGWVPFTRTVGVVVGVLPLVVAASWFAFARARVAD